MKIYMAGSLGMGLNIRTIRETLLIEMKCARLFSYFIESEPTGFKVWLDANIWGVQNDVDCD